MEFRDADPDELKSVLELRRSAKGRKILVERGAPMKGYARGKKTINTSEVPFTERRFVSWDGEGTQANVTTDHVTIAGVDLPYERAQSKYVLFGNSDDNYVYAPDLATAQCLELIISAADKDAIHFGFAFDYDVNMILRDLSRNHLRILREKGSVIWQRWRIEYLPKKWFLVTDRMTHRTVRIWDVFSFFMSSAVKAWEKYGVEVSETVLRGKEDRGTVAYEQLWTHMYPYWKEENQAYVTLMEKLRESLHAADLYISAWHGPGAIASHSMAKHGVNRYMGTVPEAVNSAAQYAYGGGRFELFKVGRANRKVYEYDINSAYPYAIAQLPDLSKGVWRHVQNPDGIARFGVYRVRLRISPVHPVSNVLRPMPFLYRDPKGQVSFPCVVDTWVWSPELWGKKNFPGLEIVEGWEYEEIDDSRPFSWLAENYEIRKRYVHEGNPAQLALKLQMNSMYGKMAQRVGWNEEKFMPPKWHQLEWAGWVTSYCRSMVYRAALHAGRDLVAFETDAVFSLSPIGKHLELGESLGEWKETVYDDFIYLQSGCRFGLVGDDWQEKYRGFDKGSIKLDNVLSALSGDPESWHVVGTTRRFIGFAQALNTNMKHWREFQSDKARIMHIGGEGKRRHVARFCRACHDGKSGTETMHDCALVSPVGGESHKHPLPWKDPELLMTQDLADQHKYGVEYL